MTSQRWWGALFVLLIVTLIARQGTLVALVLVLALAGGLSELWSRRALWAVHYERQLQADHLTFGEETGLVLTFTNAKPLPLAWLSVHDQFPAALTLLTGEARAESASHRTALNSLVSLRWYERVIHRHRVRGDQRGVFTLGPAELSSGDILGFRTCQAEAPERAQLIVYPKVVSLEALGLPADRPLGEWLAIHRVQEDPLRFAMVRDYQPGDAVRAIHWKASAHAGHLQTKVYDPGATPALVLAVDVPTLPGSYEYRPDELEYLIVAAASLARHALDQGYLVGLAANSIDSLGHHDLYLPPGRHPQQLQILLTALASLTPLRGAPFEATLDALATQLPYGATVVAISALLRDEMLETLLTLRAAGRPLVLWAVGEAPPNVPDELPAIFLRGAHDWRELEALQLA